MFLCLAKFKLNIVNRGDCKVLIIMFHSWLISLWCVCVLCQNLRWKLNTWTVCRQAHLPRHEFGCSSLHFKGITWIWCNTGIEWNICTLMHVTYQFGPGFTALLHVKYALILMNPSDSTANQRGGQQTLQNYNDAVGVFNAWTCTCWNPNGTQAIYIYCIYNAKNLINRVDMKQNKTKKTCVMCLSLFISFHRLLWGRFEVCSVFHAPDFVTKRQGNLALHPLGRPRFVQG